MKPSFNKLYLAGLFFILCSFFTTNTLVEAQTITVVVINETSIEPDWITAETYPYYQSTGLVSPAPNANTPYYNISGSALWRVTLSGGSTSVYAGPPVYDANYGVYITVGATTITITY